MLVLLLQCVPVPPRPGVPGVGGVLLPLGPATPGRLGARRPSVPPVACALARPTVAVQGGYRCAGLKPTTSAGGAVVDDVDRLVSQEGPTEADTAIELSACGRFARLSIASAGHGYVPPHCRHARLPSNMVGTKPSNGVVPGSQPSTEAALTLHGHVLSGTPDVDDYVTNRSDKLSGYGYVPPHLRCAGQPYEIVGPNLPDRATPGVWSSTSLSYSVGPPCLTDAAAMAYAEASTTVDLDISDIACDSWLAPAGHLGADHPSVAPFAAPPVRPSVDMQGSTQDVGLQEPTAESTATPDDIDKMDRTKGPPEKEDDIKLMPKTYISQMMSMAIGSWKKLCDDHDHKDTDGLVTALKDESQFTITCHVLGIEGTPLETNKQKALSMTHKVLDGVKENGVDTLKLPHNPRDDAWFHWKTELDDTLTAKKPEPNKTVEENNKKSSPHSTNEFDG